MINIVLLEPQIPQNTGNIARTCAATGSRLHLVKPMGFTVDDKKLKRAGLDYWHLLDITYYESTKEFFEKNQGEMYFFTTKGKKIYSDVSYPDGCYLVFGREDRGINEKILAANYDRCVRFPMLDDDRCFTSFQAFNNQVMIPPRYRIMDMPESCRLELERECKQQ